MVELCIDSAVLANPFPRRRSASCSGLSNLCSLLFTRALPCHQLTATASNPPRKLLVVCRDGHSRTRLYTTVWVAGVARRFLSLPAISELHKRLFNAAGLNMFRPTRIDRLLAARGKIFIRHSIKFEWLIWTRTWQPERIWRTHIAFWV